MLFIFFFKLKGIKTDKERKGEMQVEPKMTFFLKSTRRLAKIKPRVQTYSAYFSFASKQSKHLEGP